MRRFIAFTITLAASCGGLVAQNLKPREDFKFLKKAAFQIDQQIAAFYRSKNLAVPPVTNDATFLRRAFLVAMGRIPTTEEALVFMEIQDADKREALIDYLIKSGGFASHMTNWAFDLLRVTDRRIGSGANNEPYRYWVRAAMATSMPWDEFTHQLIASSGDG